jgi:hypothetical protein
MTDKMEPSRAYDVAQALIFQVDHGGGTPYTVAEAEEQVAALSRPAPDPTEPGTRGKPRLSARFVEWLMGLPSGYITDHVSRNAALRILGNGVVPQQGAYALHHLDPPGAAVLPTKTAAAPGHHNSQGARFGTLRAPWGSVPNVPRQGGAT